MQKSLSTGHTSSVGIPNKCSFSACGHPFIDTLDVVAKTGRELEHACKVISKLERILVLGYWIYYRGETIPAD